MNIINQKNLFPLIAETSPYLFDDLNQISLVNNNIEFTFDQSFNFFKRENFSDLVKTLSTVGSLNLANKINSNSVNYFLAEKLRIRKTSFGQPEGLLLAKSSSQLFDDRKGKSLIEVEDQNTTIYKFEIDYYIINKPSFEKIFAQFYNPEKKIDSISSLPTTTIEYITDTEFILTIEEFEQNNCLGHFDDYPIVPAVFITKCIISNILKILPFNFSNDIEIDNLEMFLIKAMPINTIFKVNIKIFTYLKNLKTYKCTVSDGKTEYGHYLITLKL